MTSINDLTVEEEVQLENVLFGIDVDGNDTIMDVMDTGNESDARDVDGRDETLET